VGRSKNWNISFADICCAKDAGKNCYFRCSKIRNCSVTQSRGSIGGSGQVAVKAIFNLRLWFIVLNNCKQEKKDPNVQ